MKKHGGSTGESSFSVLVVLLHHLLDEGKRVAIQEWAIELNLAGWSRYGTPGCIVAEGSSQDLQTLVSRLRALRWQSMEIAAYSSSSSRVIVPDVWQEVQSMRDLKQGLVHSGLEALFALAQSGEGSSSAIGAFGGPSAMEYHEKRAADERASGKDPTRA